MNHQRREGRHVDRRGKNGDSEGHAPLPPQRFKYTGIAWREWSFSAKSSSSWSVAGMDASRTHVGGGAQQFKWMSCRWSTCSTEPIAFKMATIPSTPHFDPILKRGRKEYREV